MQITEIRETWTALYARLSLDDGNVGESMSIQSQKAILTRKAEELGIYNYRFYVDDGYSGTNFNRPSFQQMIADIEAGKVTCVITKDLSRLGRNYLESGAYIEVFFPKHQVRYIAVNDGAVELERLVRGLNPWPSAYTFLNGKTLKVWKCAVERAECGKEAPGTIIGVDKSGIHVACGSDTLILKEVQLEGKKRMETDAFLRGYQVTAGTMLKDHKE